MYINLYDTKIKILKIPGNNRIKTLHKQIILTENTDNYNTLTFTYR